MYSTKCGDFSKFAGGAELLPEIARLGTQVFLHVAGEVRQRRESDQVGDVGES